MLDDERCRLCLFFGNLERQLYATTILNTRRFDILDLDEEHSFLRWLSSQGFRPLVVDWNSPGDEEKDFTVTDYIVKRLRPALHEIVSHVDAPIHIVGYCMGGLLAMALAALEPRLSQSLTLIATPWDFHEGNTTTGAEYVDLAYRLEPYLEQFHHMPVDTIQALFAVLQPLKVMDKFSAFAASHADSVEAQRFVMLEDWLNDGVPLTAAVARECLLDWYGHNKTARGQWTVAGHLIDPKNFPMPCYVLVPGKDRIVPPLSALPLARLFPNATLHEPKMGHIGLMAGRRAPQDVWAPFATWLQQHAAV